MPAPSKIIINSINGCIPGIDLLVEQWILDKIKYIGVVGVDSSRIECIIDELCVGDGTNPYFMLTASHGNDETLEDAIFLAESLLSEEFDGAIQVIEF